jgi:uncharacterized protein (DUF39 family)
MGKKVEVSSLSSYNKAAEITEILKEEIERGDFLLSEPSSLLPKTQSMKGLKIRREGK